MSSQAIKVGIVGYGYAGRVFHAQLIQLTQGLELYAVASRNPERRRQAQQDYGIVTYETIDQLLADPHVDLVIIATPHDTHAKMAIKVMNAGKHCIVDKPMCITVAEADAMLRARDRNGVLLSVFHNRRWDSDFLTLQHAIDVGLLGEPFLIQSCVARYGAPRSGWRCDRKCMGSILHDWGVHLVDQALQLTGEFPSAVLCHTHFRRWQMTVESYAWVELTFESGLLYHIEVSYLSSAPRPRWYAVGDKGGFIKYGLDPQETALQQGDIRKAREAPENRARVWTQWNGTPVEMTLDSVPGKWTVYYENIANVLLNDAELAVKPEETRQVIRVIDAALKSARRGKQTIISS